MSTIKISDLQPTGYDLLSDSESYLRELSEEELHTQVGGSSFLCISISLIVLTWPKEAY